jgi:hypothetical protein
LQSRYALVGHFPYADEGPNPFEGISRAFQENNSILPSMADFVLTNGSKLEFYDIDEGGVKGIFMAEIGNCIKDSPLSKVDLLNNPHTSPLDVFWAISAPGTPVPSMLRELFINLTGDAPYGQGWAEKDVVSRQPAMQDQSMSEIKGNSQDTAMNSLSDLACNDQVFTSPPPGGFLSSSPFIRLNKRPSEYGGFTKYYEPFGSFPAEIRYQYRAALGNTYISKSKLCGKCIENSNHSHWYYGWPGHPFFLAPRLAFQIKTDQGWVYAKSKTTGKTMAFDIPANQLTSLYVTMQTNVRTLHAVRIDSAKDFDQFDILLDVPIL